MPLPPLPESNTGRLYVNYLFGADAHTVQFRQLSPFTKNDTIGWAAAWLGTWVALFQAAVEFHSADWSDMGSDIRNPVPWTPITGTAATLTDPTNRSRSMTFVGRSPDGRKLRIFFYGGKFGPDATYRVLTTEDPTLNGAIQDLNGLDSRVGTISGSAPIFKPYVNIRNNAYWQTELRQ